MAAESEENASIWLQHTLQQTKQVSLEALRKKVLENSAGTFQAAPYTSTIRKYIKRKI